MNGMDGFGFPKLIKQADKNKQLVSFISSFFISLCRPYHLIFPAKTYKLYLNFDIWTDHHE